MIGMDDISTAGRALAVFGLFLFILWYFTPPRLSEFMSQMPGTFGFLVSSAIAIAAGFFMSAIGG